MRLLIEIRRIEVSFGIAGFLRLCTSPQQLSTVIHSYLHRFSTIPPGSEKSGLSPPSLPLKLYKTQKPCSRGRLCAIFHALKSAERFNLPALFSWAFDGFFILPLPEQALLPSGGSSATDPFHPDGIRSRQTASDHQFSD